MFFGIGVYPRRLLVHLEYFFRDSATKEDFETRVLRFHNCTHDRLMHLDALFYSKNGRSGYLQVPYYESLEDWLQTTPSSQAIMAVVKDTLEALRALHAHAIVHGQVDSSNVFVLKKDGDGLARGILGLYDFSEKWEQRMAVTSSKIDGLPEDTPKCAKFDVMCLGQLLKSISHLNVLNEDADLQSLLDSLLPAHTTCVPTVQQALDMPFFHKVNGPVEDELD
ncbi:hypothetical protein QZH41_015150 [Actinostola sp. cb2023]|nr:hypothetical protein QZH41_015150 [Actinostola sp. cb2023]